MTHEQSIEIAYRIIVSNLPASWIEQCDKSGNAHMTPRAVRLRTRIAHELRKAWLDGHKAGRDMYGDTPQD